MTSRWRPVRPAAGYRLRKLARKHRTALGIAGLIAVLLVLAGAVSAWQAVRATLAERGMAERDRAEQEKDRAEASFRMARETVDRFFTQVGESPKLKAQGMEKFRKELLQNAKEFYERFIRERLNAPEVRQDLGQAHVRLAKIHQALGDFAAAQTSVGESHRDPGRAGAGPARMWRITRVTWRPVTSSSGPCISTSAASTRRRRPIGKPWPLKRS